MSDAIVIPWQESADFQFEMSLDSHVYLLRARWNDYCKAWGLDISSRAKTPLILGIRLSLHIDALYGMNNPEHPPGGLMVMGVEPQFDSFMSGESQLVYLPVEMIDAL